MTENVMDPLYREQKAAEYLCVSVGTLQQWRSAGRGPSYRKLGKRVLYAQRDLEEYVENLRRRSSTSQEVTSRPGPTAKRRRRAS